MNVLIGLGAGALVGLIMSFMAPSFKMEWLPRIAWIIIGAALGVGLAIGVFK